MPLPIVNTFAGNPLDRAADRRLNADYLETAVRAADAMALVFSKGRPLLERDGSGGLRIAYVRADTTLALTDQAPTFLGLWRDAPVFATETASESDFADLGDFTDLREAALRLSAAEAGICATAKSLFDWRARRRFCSVCGQPNATREGGWKQVCTACDAEHFPRTDPVVIMLATYQGRCLLGRQERWPRRMFSALAGFVEPGESIEEACARELKEEAGLTVTSVRYHSSQPWPYPSSLMIGLMAEVDGDQVTPDPVEVHEHRWLTKEEARQAVHGGHPEIGPMSPMAIACTLVRAWAEEA